MAGILIVSAPRSGSSCTAGLLHLHGFSLGVAHTLHVDEFNEKGYFENSAILNFNREVLNDIGVDVFCTERPTASQISRSLDFSSRLREIISDQYTGDFCIKDPRIAVLQDLYLSVLSKPKVILLSRKAEDVACSIQRMREYPLPRGVRVAEVYSLMLDDLSYKTGRCLRVNFENILHDMHKLCRWLGVEYREDESRAFVEERLVHYK